MELQMSLSDKCRVTLACEIPRLVGVLSEATVNRTDQEYIKLIPAKLLVYPRGSIFLYVAIAYKLCQVFHNNLTS